MPTPGEDGVPASRRPTLFDMLFTHGMQTTFDIILNLFFSRMEILGLDNFPKYGPTIIVGNHNNQFADGILLSSKVYELGRECRFIIAEKSWHRPIIGDLAKAIKCIPVARAQDNAKAGQGKVSGTTGEKVIKGDGCNFTAVFAAKDSIKAGSAQYRVEAVDDDNTLRLMDALTESLADVPYKILKRIDQDVVYRRVYDLFQDGGVLGIFPEGGSHDRTEMLELKPGVCIMALGAMQMHPELDVKIVPCGLNYMAGHKFRSKVVIQFGPPIEIPRTLVEQYATDKRGAVAALLHQVQRSMKDVVVEAPDYDALTMIHTMRRLYTPLGRKLDPKEYHILNKRLSTIYYEHGALDGFDTLLGDLRAYRELIADYSLSDSQVARMQLAALRGRKRNATLVLAKRVPLLIVTTLIALPGMALSYPIQLVGEHVAAQKAKEALAGSDVKIKALDVMASWKLIILLIMVPTLVVAYTAIFFVTMMLFSSWPFWLIVVATGFVAAFLPAYGNYSLKLFDDIARGARTLKPLYLRATGAIHPESQELIEERARLQAKVRTMINTLGPTIFPDFAEIRLIKPEEFEQEAQLLARIRRHSMTQDLPADDDGADDDIDLAQDDDADVLQD